MLFKNMEHEKIFLKGVFKRYKCPQSGCIKTEKDVIGW